MRSLLLASAIILLASSCATTPAIIPVRLECPPPIHLPVMTTMQSLEMNRLSATTFTILIQRENLLKERNETLCSIIESTQP